MKPKKIDQIGCIDIGSNAIKYKQFRIIADDNQSYSKELETYKRIPIRLGTDAFRKGKIRKKTNLGRVGPGPATGPPDRWTLRWAPMRILSVVLSARIERPCC